MNTAFLSEDSARTQGSHATPGNRSGGRLLRRTFIIALVLVSGGLLTSGAVELFFRYRESVEGIWALQREMAQGAAFKIQQFVQDIEKTLRASTQTPDIVTAGLTAGLPVPTHQAAESHSCDHHGHGTGCQRPRTA